MGGNSFTVTFFRSFFVVIILLIASIIKKIDLRISLSEFIRILIIGFFGASMTTLLLYSSFNIIDVGTGTTLHFMYPVFVNLLCLLYIKRK